jgi:rhodanese-related sulfurtransferase
MSAAIPNVSPAQTWEQLKANPAAKLIDVRTQPEWTYVGVPDLASIGKQVLLLSWQVYPNNARNEAFAQQLAAQGITPETPLYLLCRSGVRSLAAGEHLSQLGYSQCFNVEDGFEGPVDQSRHRGSTAGWKASGLPWLQG